MIPKFRAWDSDKKEMFKDTFAVTENGEVIICEQETVFNSPDYIFVHNLLIMQSTGLLDKNGVEVFEGDVVQRSLPSGAILFGTVEFTKGLFLVDGIETISDEYIVIGNIWEHPELVKDNE